MLLEVSEDYKLKLADEMFANNETWEEFVDGDVVRAYYFGILLPVVCKDLEGSGFKVASAEEQLMGLRWNCRKHRRQINYWQDKYIESNGRAVNVIALHSYILEKMVVSNDELLEIATMLGYNGYVMLEST